MVAVLREDFIGGAKPTTLAAQLAAGATSLSVVAGGLATWTPVVHGRIPVVIARGEADEERLYATAVSGDSLTGLIRGQDGTADQVHATGRTVEVGLFADHVDEPNRFLALPTAAGQIAVSDGAGSWTAGDLPAGVDLDAPAITDFSAAQHDHTDFDDGGFLPTAAPTTSAVGDTASTGTQGSYATSGHRHAREGFGNPGASAVGDSMAPGAATTVARSDHRHSRENFGAAATTIALGDTSATGAATVPARSDHRHGLPVGPVVALPAQTTNGAGVSTDPPRADHTHGLPIQAGTIAINLAAASAGTGAITFPVAFAAPPIVQLTVQVGSSADIIPNLTAAPTAGAAQVRVFQRALASVTATVTVHWLAYGTLA